MVSLNVTVSGQVLLYSVAGFGLFTFLLIILMRRYLHRRSARIGQVSTPPRTAAERNKYRVLDVFRFRAAFLQYGLIFALSLALLGFAWTEKEARSTYLLSGLEELPELMITPPIVKPPQPLPPTPPPILETIPDEQILEDEEPEFVDLSLESNEAVIAPEPVKQEVVLPPPMPVREKEEENVTEIFKFVEEMPLFPGCSDLPTKEERKQCSDKELMRFLSDNIRYPAIARENGIEGIAVVSFVVERDGTITDPSVVREPGGGLGDEALRVVRLMNEQGVVWTPGQQRKRPVRVQFNLPVRFKLQ